MVAKKATKKANKPLTRTTKRTRDGLDDGDDGEDEEEGAARGGGEWRVPLCVGVCASCIYAWTAFPSVGGGDSGELLAEACVGGVAHPPGYGLYLFLTSSVIDLCGLLGSLSAGRAGAYAAAVYGGVASFGVAMSAAELSDRHGDVAAVVAGVGFASSALVWEYSTQAEVFALNNALVSLGVLCAVKLASNLEEHRRRKVVWFHLAAVMCGLCGAHQHAALLTAAPMAAGCLYLSSKKKKKKKQEELVSLIPSLAVSAAAAWFVPTVVYLSWRSSFATEGSWGDLTTWTGLIRHVTRAEYGTFRLGASSRGSSSDGGYIEDSLRRVVAYLKWTVEQGTVAAPALAALGAVSSGKKQQQKAVVVFGWVVYVVAWHFVWSNLRIFDSAMAYEVHARFWMQAHLSLCVVGGAGAAVVSSAMADKGVAVASSAWSRLIVLVALSVARLMASWLDYSGAWIMRTHGAAVVAGLAPNSLLLSHTDLHWNPSRYLQHCEKPRSSSDVSHVSLQLLPYPWFARQAASYPGVVFPEIEAPASTDLRSPAYERMLVSLIAANMDSPAARGGVYLDIHGVYEPHIGSMGLWGETPYALVPWGLNYRVLDRSSLKDAQYWLGESLKQLSVVRALYDDDDDTLISPLTRLSELLATYRQGTWERAAICAFYDAHYQTGLWSLTFAQQLRSQITQPEVFLLYLDALRHASRLTALASKAAVQGALTSNARDAEKNALLAATTLHGALVVAGRFFPETDDDLTQELATVAAEATAQARVFLATRLDDKDHAVFAKFLASIEEQQSLKAPSS